MTPHRPPPSDAPGGDIDAGIDDDLDAGEEPARTVVESPVLVDVDLADDGDLLASPDGDDGEGPSFARNLLEWGGILLGALVALVVTKFLIQAFFIPSASMFPTLKVDDRVLVNKLSYDLHDVNRGDLVVFERPPSEGGSDVKDLIKRVVAIAGDRVESRDGQLVVNGVALDEPYVADGAETSGVESQTVPDGHVFVMGDNREDSRDSRFFGPLPEDLIIGRAFVKVWPVTDIGLL